MKDNSLEILKHSYFGVQAPVAAGGKILAHEVRINVALPRLHHIGNLRETGEAVPALCDRRRGAAAAAPVPAAPQRRPRSKRSPAPALAWRAVLLSPRPLRPRHGVLTTGTSTSPSTHRGHAQAWHTQRSLAKKKKKPNAPSPHGAAHGSPLRVHLQVHHNWCVWARRVAPHIIAKGDMGVGKSCLLPICRKQNVLHRESDLPDRSIVVPDSPHTIGVEFGTKIIDVLGKTVKLQIWVCCFSLALWH